MKLVRGARATRTCSYTHVRVHMHVLVTYPGPGHQLGTRPSLVCFACRKFVCREHLHSSRGKQFLSSHFDTTYSIRVRCGSQ